jgi:hypothetical protein
MLKLRKYLTVSEKKKGAAINECTNLVMIAPTDVLHPYTIAVVTHSHHLPSPLLHT